MILRSVLHMRKSFDDAPVRRISKHILLGSGLTGVRWFRKLNSRKEVILPVQQLPSPPASPEPEMLFAMDLDKLDLPDELKQLSQPWQNGFPAGFKANHSGATEAMIDPKSVRRRGRIGRGGRVCFDR